MLKIDQFEVQPNNDAPPVSFIIRASSIDARIVSDPTKDDPGHHSKETTKADIGGPIANLRLAVNPNLPEGLFLEDDDVGFGIIKICAATRDTLELLIADSHLQRVAEIVEPPVLQEVGETPAVAPVKEIAA